MALIAVRPVDDPLGAVLLVEVGDRSVIAEAGSDEAGISSARSRPQGIGVGDTVLVDCGDLRRQCLVVASPEQVVQAGVSPEGTVVQVLESEQSHGDADIAIAEERASRLPYLGQGVQMPVGSGSVEKLDVPAGLLTVRLESGEVRVMEAIEVEQLDLGEPTSGAKEDDEADDGEGFASQP